MAKETYHTHDPNLLPDKPGPTPSAEETRKAMALGIEKIFLPFSKKLEEIEVIQREGFIIVTYSNDLMDRIRRDINEGTKTHVLPFIRKIAGIQTISELLDPEEDEIGNDGCGKKDSWPAGF